MKTLKINFVNFALLVIFTSVFVLSFIINF